MKRLGISVALVVSSLIAPPVGATTDVDADLERVFNSLYAVYDTAFQIEQHAKKRGRLPKAKSPVELSKAIFGTDMAADLLVDGWKTPLHVHSDPATNTYVVVSAGSDRKFDRSKWGTRVSARNAAEDIVLRNGEMVRSPEEWASSLFSADRAKAADQLSAARDVAKATRTMADLRSIASAMDTYTIDHGSLPRAKNIRELAAALEPKYISNMPRTDAWGTEFAIELVPSSENYRLIAAGSDRKFDSKRWQEKGKTLDYARDAVLQSGELTAEWSREVPASKIAEAWAGYMAARERLASVRAAGPAEKRLRGRSGDR